MQPRLAINRFPSKLLVVVFALVAALLLGGAMGYALKPNGAAPASLGTAPQMNSAYEPGAPTVSRSGRSL